MWWVPTSIQLVSAWHLAVGLWISVLLCLLLDRLSRGAQRKQGSCLLYIGMRLARIPEIHLLPKVLLKQTLCCDPWQVLTLMDLKSSAHSCSGGCINEESQEGAGKESREKECTEWRGCTDCTITLWIIESWLCLKIDFGKDVARAGDPGGSVPASSWNHGAKSQACKVLF